MTTSKTTPLVQIGKSHIESEYNIEVLARALLHARNLNSQLWEIHRRDLHKIELLEQALYNKANPKIELIELHLL